MSGRNEIVVIEKSRPGERLDTYLRSIFRAVSRGTIQRLIEEGHIKVNGQNVKPTHSPRAGEEISVYWPEARPAEAQPEDIPLNILYEDDDLLVLNKPPGMVVHPGAGNDEHTLVNALLHYCKGKLSGIGGVARPGIVHRLDKDTSGCLVVAKNDTTHQALAEQFASRSLEKIYLAIVCGEMPRASGDIRAAISRHASHREGRAAHTTYRVLERLTAATLVEVVLHTGRTHQIRVHFQYVGFPVAGDNVYGKRQNTRLTELTSYAAPRQLLHAHKISFLQPRTGRKLKVEAPWPGDFDQALKALRGAGRNQ